MAIKFKKTSDELHLIYTPDILWHSNLREKLSGDGYRLARTFHLNTSRLVDGTVMQLDDPGDIDEFIFRIGIVEGDYIRLDKEIFGTEHHFFISSDIKLERKFFVYRAWNSDRSILLNIDKMVSEDDIYIGGSYENAIPLDDYKKLVEFFPHKAELEKYSQMRIAGIIEEYCRLRELYYDKFDKYIAQKDASINKTLSIKPEKRFIENIKLSIQQFRRLKDELDFLLERSSGISEEVWQENIHSIIRLLFPKYILSVREVKIPGVDKKDKRVDFMLVDYNGNIDLLEIKKPQVEIITATPSYRGNYISRRDLSGTVQQIQKYIYCLNRWGGKGEDELNKKYKDRLPEGIKIHITNPKGILILGRSNNLNPQQLNDLELIKRQFANIFEIMTYDDLIQSIDNILEMLERDLSSSS